MKIEVKLHHPSGDVKNYPVHKLVRNNDGWTASYTTVKAGRHESRKVKLEDIKAELEVNMEEKKPELNPEVIFDRNGIKILPEVAYLGPHKDIAIKQFNANNFQNEKLGDVWNDYIGQTLEICDKVINASLSSIKAKLSSLLLKAAYALRQAESVQEYIKKLEVEK